MINDPSVVLNWEVSFTYIDPILKSYQKLQEHCTNVSSSLDAQGHIVLNMFYQDKEDMVLGSKHYAFVVELQIDGIKQGKH